MRQRQVVRPDAGDLGRADVPGLRLEGAEGQLEQTPRTVRVFEGGGNDPATVSDLPFPTTVPCVATAATTVGATCELSTTFDAVMPGVIKEQDRSIWQLDTIQVLDGGADGLASTSPNTLFARQGVFIR